jgi:two-component system, chemotaxis family, chemotaxis protein CheY
MTPERTHVVVVNDNPEFLDLMADLLHDENYPVTVIDGDRADAVELIRAAVPGALIIDLRLGHDELHGLDVLREVRSDPELRELPTIICTGDKPALMELADQVAQMRRVETLMKPFSIDELMEKLQSVLAREPA